MTIAITLNGEQKFFDKELSLADLCAWLQLPERGVAVAINFELVPRNNSEHVMVRNNDVVEIVTAAAGG